MRIKGLTVKVLKWWMATIVEEYPALKAVFGNTSFNITDACNPLQKTGESNEVHSLLKKLKQLLDNVENNNIIRLNATEKELEDQNNNDHFLIEHEALYNHAFYKRADIKSDVKNFKDFLNKRIHPPMEDNDLLKELEELMKTISTAVKNIFKEIIESLLLVGFNYVAKKVLDWQTSHIAGTKLVSITSHCGNLKMVRSYCTENRTYPAMLDFVNTALNNFLKSTPAVIVSWVCQACNVSIEKFESTNNISKSSKQRVSCFERLLKEARDEVTKANYDRFGTCISKLCDKKSITIADFLKLYNQRSVDSSLTKTVDSSLTKATSSIFNSPIEATTEDENKPINYLDSFDFDLGPPFPDNNNENVFLPSSQQANDLSLSCTNENHVITLKQSKLPPNLDSTILLKQSHSENGKGMSFANMMLLANTSCTHLPENRDSTETNTEVVLQRPVVSPLEESRLLRGKKIAEGDSNRKEGLPNDPVLRLETEDNVSEGQRLSVVEKAVGRIIDVSANNKSKDSLDNVLLAAGQSENVDGSGVLENKAVENTKEGDGEKPIGLDPAVLNNNHNDGGAAVLKHVVDEPVLERVGEKVVVNEPVLEAVGEKVVVNAQNADVSQANKNIDSQKNVVATLDKVAENNPLVTALLPKEQKKLDGVTSKTTKEHKSGSKRKAIQSSLSGIKRKKLHLNFDVETTSMNVFVAGRGWRMVEVALGRRMHTIYYDYGEVEKVTTTQLESLKEKAKIDIGEVGYQFLRFWEGKFYSGVVDDILDNGNRDCHISGRGIHEYTLQQLKEFSAIINDNLKAIK